MSPHCCDGCPGRGRGWLWRLVTGSPLLCRIEKKRTVVPTLAEAVTARDGREVAWEYFYGLLFTSENLKLVHIACHKKTTHKLSCDPRRLYRPRTKPKRRRPARRGQ